jgi:hypothetical protein
VVRALRGLDDAQRLQLGESARNIVLADHTSFARARELEQHLYACIDQSRTQACEHLIEQGYA